MATVSVSTVMSSLSSIKMIVFALMLSFVLAVLIHMTIRDFHAVTMEAENWSPGYGKSLPKVHLLPKSGNPGKGVQLGLRKPLGRRQRLPSCLIIGLANSGVRKLREIINVHPGVVAANREVKFFTENSQRTQTWYRQQMPLSLPSQITVEATQDYIFSPAAMTRIFRFSANLKLIAVVQDPVHRLILTYIRRTENQPEPKQTLKEWCEYTHNPPKVLRLINYEAPIREVYKHYPPKNLLVLSKEDVEVNPQKTLEVIEDFLDLKPGLTSDDFVNNSHTGGTCFDRYGPNYPLIKDKLTPGVVLDTATGCVVGAGEMPTSPGVQADKDFFQKVVGVVQKSNIRFFRLIRKTFDWTTNFKLAS
ncbi:sulfotransferase [Elysia marginata]|uniref:Sulfotransferase n=1 Tax=Elysia marginata TaxID=1093978 RepID=A0AAV4IG28_9GAST|nr:sulfotransferase [Elysia marginata]